MQAINESLSPNAVIAMTNSDGQKVYSKTKIFTRTILSD